MQVKKLTREFPAGSSETKKGLQKNRNPRDMLLRKSELSYTYVVKCEGDFFLSSGF
jgi:hypothetical protein